MLPPLAILLVHVSTALNALGFVPWLGSRILLDKIELQLSRRSVSLLPDLFSIVVSAKPRPAFCASN